MKPLEVQTITELCGYIKKMRFITHLKPCEYRKQSYNAQLKFCGYSDMMLTVMDILKVSILALEADAPYNSTEIVDSSANVRNLLEIALQLIPIEEIQLLDEVHELYQQHNREEKENTKDGEGGV